jgi:glycerol uptake facilitator-like aquaporin
MAEGDPTTSTTAQSPATGEPAAAPPAAQVTTRYGRVKEFLVANAPLLAAVITAGMFVIIIGSLFWPYITISASPGRTLLHELSTTEVARGLITFLIAVATVGIALILTVYAVSTQDAKAKENFALAKEVLSLLIGVLGTIVGFYFGSTQNPAGNSTPLASRPTAEALIAPSGTASAPSGPASATR